MRRKVTLEPIPIDPLVDPVFKVLFGTEANKDILLSFLNSVLDFLEAPQAVSIELVPPRNLRRNAGSKETEVDVRAKDAEGRVFQIEVQLDPGGPLVPRMIYGAGQLYASTIGKGESYDELKPVVSIWLLRDRLQRRGDGADDRVNEAGPNAVSEYRYRTTRGDAIGAYPVLVVIELQNWKEGVTLKGELERWLFYFKHGKELSVDTDLPPLIRSEVFMKAVDETKRFNDTWAKRMAYESYIDKVRWNNSLRNEAEAQRRQDETQRKQDEAFRKETALIAEETERIARENESVARENESVARENERTAQENESVARENERTAQENAQFAQENAKREAELALRLAVAYKGLIAAGKTPSEAAAALGMDRAAVPE